MDDFIHHILKEASGQGLSMSFTMVACWYLHGKIKECEADRKALWERLLEHNDNHENRN
jgi:hypothetical protein